MAEVLSAVFVEPAQHGGADGVGVGDVLGELADELVGEGLRSVAAGCGRRAGRPQCRPTRLRRGVHG